MLALRWGFLVGVGALGLSAAAELSCSTDEFGSTDAGTTADTSATDALVDSGTRFCAAHPAAQGTLCDDFETDYGGGFNPAWALSVNGGTASREADPPGFVLHSAFPAVSAKRNAQLAWDPNATVARTVTFSTRLKISPSCADGIGWFSITGLVGNAGVAMGLGVATVSARKEIVLFLGSQQGDAATATQLESADDITFDVWHDVKFELAFDRPLADGGGPNGGVDLTVSVDQKPEITITGGPGGSAIAFPKFAIGATTSTSTSTCDLRMDDVLFDLKK
ncbi:hypothetical protein BH09MYX1_BH09MYX1_58070 [soil metagenome]